MKFINRNQELDYLNKKWKSKNSNFVIIYGKRRVGKTELVKQFTKNKPSVESN
jgi:AAA+ ATPase superfamily predicted ATPase